jgi:acetyl esterase
MYPDQMKRPQKPRLKGLRLRAFYFSMNVARALGLGTTAEKSMALPYDTRKNNVAPGWMTLPLPSDVKMVVETIPGRAGPIAIKKYVPAKLNPDAPRVLFIHGGGWIHGGLDTCDHLCANVVSQAGCLMVSVEYRLAPETPFPGALEDCDDALDWVAKDPSLGPMPKAGIAIMGESAGGNLTAALCVLATRRGSPAIAHQTLIYPALDATLQSESINLDQPGLEKKNMHLVLDAYRGKAAPNDPLVSPMFAENAAALPRALILTADVDPLRDDGPRFARKLSDAGVKVKYVNYPGMPHGFFFIPRLCSKQVYDGIGVISKEIASLGKGG